MVGYPRDSSTELPSSRNTASLFRTHSAPLKGKRGAHERQTRGAPRFLTMSLPSFVFFLFFGLAAPAQPPSGCTTARATADARDPW